MFYFKDLQKEECDFLRGVSGADETQIIKFIDSGQHSILMSRWTKWFWRKCTMMIHLLLRLSSSSSVHQVPLSFLIGLNQHSGDASVFLVIKTRQGSPDDPHPGSTGFHQDTFPREGLQSRTLKVLTLKMFKPWMAIILKLACAFIPTVPHTDVDAFIILLMWLHQFNLKDMSSFLRRIYFIGQPHYRDLHNEFIQTLSHIQTNSNLTKLVLCFCTAVIWIHVITDNTCWMKPQWWC